MKWVVSENFTKRVWRVDSCGYVFLHIYLYLYEILHCKKKGSGAGHLSNNIRKNFQIWLVKIVYENLSTYIWKLKICPHIVVFHSNINWKLFQCNNKKSFVLETNFIWIFFQKSLEFLPTIFWVNLHSPIFFKFF